MISRTISELAVVALGYVDVVVDGVMVVVVITVTVVVIMVVMFVTGVVVYLVMFVDESRSNHLQVTQSQLV